MITLPDFGLVEYRSPTTVRLIRSACAAKTLTFSPGFDPARGVPSPLMIAAQQHVRQRHRFTTIAHISAIEAR
ncbi:hypothetical protein [Yoonia vestfoldensis]|uniref:hypothetical protein n=1 Tax=Yoonia vestfoldensis TaxID=245188 RepID=UPI0013A54E3D|nr:hypothetical protein [Yoonia vestfoldensis]